MKTASRILLIVAGISLILSVIIGLVLTICFFLAPTVQALRNVIQDGLESARDSDLGDWLKNLIEFSVRNFEGFCFYFGLSFAIITFFDLAALILCFVGSSTTNKVIMILHIVLGFLFGGGLIELLGGVFGLLAAKQEQSQPAPAAVEKKPAE